MRELGTHFVYHIDKPLSIVPTEGTDRINPILVHKHRLDQREHLSREGGVTDQTFAGGLIKVGKDGRT